MNEKYTVIHQPVRKIPKRLNELSQDYKIEIVASCEIKQDLALIIKLTPKEKVQPQTPWTGENTETVPSFSEPLNTGDFN